MTQADLLKKITNILGLSVNQQVVLSDHGYEMISNIINWKYEEKFKWCTTNSKLRTELRIETKNQVITGVGTMRP